MSNRITQQELESYLWGAAVYLRGTIDAGDYKQFIFPLLFYKRVCDVFDEETRAALAESGGDESFAAYPENHRFQVPADAHWRRVRNTASDIGQTLQSGMRAIETANPDKLFGIFGDAQWTNKDRLSDAMLRDLVEHFSTLDLSIANLPEDELGQGYEYLIKKFADDSGHTAAEFYTNRTVVHLMTELLEPQPGESIYDPTCGSGGMLLSTIARLRRQGKEWRNVRLYGQERNLMTSSIARMNCFLHGIEDFQVVRGDTLSDPKFIRGDRLMQFDVVLANPPYSIKQWDRAAFAADPWGRNIYGTPPQGRADYAFWQHILCSLKPDTGRSAILFPHGVLFRQEEAEMRRRLIEADVIECVLGLGPNLFYNSPMEACVVICRTTKPSKRRGRILFINAVDQVTRERAQSFLADEHIERIVEAYRGFTDEPGFTRVATLEEVRAKGGRLSIPLYVESTTANGAEESASENTLVEALDAWATSRVEVASILPKVLPDASLPMLEEFIITSKADKIFEDRDGWARVRFGDVVENLTETERNPVESGLERFIGLEHLEPGSLHVRTWGSVADGTTFTRRCRPGQVLFGKRRAYQRKVAIAEFDAVVSGDIYVLAPKNDRLLPELLPFIGLSERFFQHAVATSAGSLSPRTNWNSLARFEFELPPMDQQRRIAEMMWAVDEVSRRAEDMRLALQRLGDVFFDAELRKWTRAEPATLRNLGDALLGITAGRSPRAASIPAQEGEFGVLKVSAIGNGVFIEDENKALMDPSDFVPSVEVRPGMILVTRCNALLSGVGRACLVEKTRPGLMLSDKTLQLVSDDEVIYREFLLQGLRRDPYRSFVERSASGTDAKNITQKALSSAPFWIPSLGLQAAIIEHLCSLRRATDAALQNCLSLSRLGSSLINAMGVGRP